MNRHKNPKRQKIEKFPNSRFGNSFKKEVKKQHMKL